MNPPPRYEPPKPTSTASVRPGLHAPAVEGGEVPTTADVSMAIEQARQLFRVSRLPRADASWPHIRPHLLVAESRLNRILRDNPDDDEAGALLGEVRRYLGRNP